MTRERDVAELYLQRLIESGALVDTFPIVNGAILLGKESYGLKHVELLTDFARGHNIDKGAGAIVEYEMGGSPASRSARSTGSRGVTSCSRRTDSTSR